MKEILHRFNYQYPNIKFNKDNITIEHCHPQTIDFSQIGNLSACVSYIRQRQEEQSIKKNFEDAALLAREAGKGEGVIKQVEVQGIPAPKVKKRCTIF